MADNGREKILVTHSGSQFFSGIRWQPRVVIRAHVVVAGPSGCLRDALTLGTQGRTARRGHRPSCLPVCAVKPGPDRIAEGRLALAQIIHAGGGLARDGDGAAEQFVILRLGYDGGPAGGPVAGGSRGPGGTPSVLQGWLFAGQGACGRGR